MPSPDKPVKFYILVEDPDLPDEAQPPLFCVGMTLTSHESYDRLYELGIEAVHQFRNETEK